MKVKRTCLVCNKPFIAIKETQKFDSRKCFKKDYYQRNKEKSNQEGLHPKHPVKTCLFCKGVSEIKFDPILSPKLFNSWKCPYCQVTNMMVWENQDNPKSFQVISNLISSLQARLLTNQGDGKSTTITFSSIYTFTT